MLLRGLPSVTVGDLRLIEKVGNPLQGSIADPLGYRNIPDCLLEDAPTAFDQAKAVGEAFTVRKVANRLGGCDRLLRTVLSGPGSSACQEYLRDGIEQAVARCFGGQALSTVSVELRLTVEHEATNLFRGGFLYGLLHYAQ
jgi:hypothetical protein